MGKRRNFWIDAPLQLQMLGYVLVMLLASLLLVTFTMLRGLDQAATDSKQLFHSLDWVRSALRGPLLLSSAISILAGGLVTLIWSHRFAGPLRVLSAAIGRLSHGNLSVPVRVRATDLHQDLIHEFAMMQDSLRQRVIHDRQLADEIRQKVESLGASIAKSDPLHRELEALATRLKELGADYKL
ncbi:MAG: methyl-accepting chemotaxis protein [Elusimicrobia bacterium]|nr:methyl-accepting chemotaxis protein [Elusimicrobiota bacterium]